MRIGCAICGLILVLLLALMATSVIFASKCGNLSRADNTATYPLMEPTSDAEMVEFQFLNTYITGSLEIIQGNKTDGQILVEEYALKVRPSLCSVRMKRD